MSGNERIDKWRQREGRGMFSPPRNPMKHTSTALDSSIPICHLCLYVTVYDDYNRPSSSSNSRSSICEKFCRPQLE